MQPETDEPRTDEVAPSTPGPVGAVRDFTIHQRNDLRWVFRIDGEDSAKTYPTAGEAERGAIAAVIKIRKQKMDSWKVAPIALAIATPVLYLLWLAYRFISSMFAG